MVAELSKIISASAEAELLVHCARLEINAARAERIRSLAGSDLDWTRLLALAQRHALIPLLFFHLNRVAADQVPPNQLKLQSLVRTACVSGWLRPHVRMGNVEPPAFAGGFGRDKIVYCRRTQEALR